METKEKIYIAGNTSLVGSAIHCKFSEKGYGNFVFTPYPEYDLREQNQVNTFFQKEKRRISHLISALTEARKPLSHWSRRSDQKCLKYKEELKQGILGSAFGLPQVLVGQFRHFSSTGSSHDETFLNQKRFVDLFNGLGVFSHGS